MSCTIPPLSRLLRRSLLTSGSLMRPCSSIQKGSNPPIEPVEGLCCGQGCTNCVWIVYANELINYYITDYLFSCGERADDTIKEIEKKVVDPNVRAFVLSEVRAKLKQS